MEVPRNPALWTQQQALALVVLDHAREAGEVAGNEAQALFHNLLESVREDYSDWSNDTSLELLIAFVLMHDTATFLRSQEEVRGNPEVGTALLTLLDTLEPPFQKSLVNDTLALLEAYYHRLSTTGREQAVFPRDLLAAVTSDYQEQELEDLVRLLSYYYRFTLKVFLPYHDSGDAVKHYLMAFCKVVAEALTPSS